MTTNDKFRRTIFSVFDELNEQWPPDRRLPKADTTPLVGPGAVLDSLGLVNFIVALEQRIEADFQTSISLIDDDLVSEESHFANVASLTSYLSSILPVRVDE
jgi:acyl carrier protein